jgi:hypothetical protein
MNREERIERARRMAAEHAPPPEVETHKRASRVAQRLANVGSSQAQRHVVAAERTGTTAYLDKVENPGLWDRVVDLARLIAISRAKRRDTVTSGEIRWVILDELKILVDDAAFTELALAVGGDSNGVLLGSIMVDPHTGQPDDDFLLEAMEQGFDEPVETLQRQVYEHFR